MRASNFWEGFLNELYKLRGKFGLAVFLQIKHQQTLSDISVALVNAAANKLGPATFAFKHSSMITPDRLKNMKFALSEDDCLYLLSADGDLIQFQIVTAEIKGRGIRVGPNRPDIV